MKLVLNVVKTNPSNIEEVVMEDVSHYSVDDNLIKIYFNTGEEETINLRDNDGQGQGEWIGISAFTTRKFLNVDMSR